ncbi:MAG: hypothetical protein JXB49_24690 [Bacteroidales bacterium]|nr:hypothetical protein [Bacteroidales bacterium]
MDLDERIRGLDTKAKLLGLQTENINDQLSSHRNILDSIIEVLEMKQ